MGKGVVKATVSGRFGVERNIERPRAAESRRKALLTAPTIENLAAPTLDAMTRPEDPLSALKLSLGPRDEPQARGVQNHRIGLMPADSRQGGVTAPFPNIDQTIRNSASVIVPTIPVRVANCTAPAPPTPSAS